MWDENLFDKFKEYVEQEEARIEKNLEDIKYILDGQDTMVLVAGNGRLEKVGFAAE